MSGRALYMVLMRVNMYKHMYPQQDKIQLYFGEIHVWLYSIVVVLQFPFDLLKCIEFSELPPRT